MKRFLCAFLIGMLILCCSCTATTPKAVVAKGQPYIWSDGNRMTVTEVKVKEGVVEVEVELDFSTANADDLKQMKLRRTNGEADPIPCKQVITQQNQVFLMFESPVIKEKMDLEQYVLTVPVGKDNYGKMVTKDAMALS